MSERMHVQATTLHRKHMMATVLSESAADLFHQAAVSTASALASSSGYLAFVSRQQLVLGCPRKDMVTATCVVQVQFASVSVHANLPPVHIQLQCSHT